MNSQLVLAVATCVFALALPVSAQQSLDYASVSGRIADPSGAVVRDADVSIRHRDTNVLASARTDSEGRFRFPYLRVGLYTLTVRMNGFAEAGRELTLGAGAAFELPITLSVMSLDSQVTVKGATPVLETARSQIAGRLGVAEVNTLPLNGRNALDAALLVPGVSPANIPGTQIFQETSAIPGIALSVNSQRNLSNNFVVDGLSANDDAAALSGTTYGVDAVEQLQVVTSGGQAEMGRALGGYVNIVTRSGTNVVRGSAYGYFRDDALNGINALTGRTLPMRQAQFGGTLGGPVTRDRSFYFANAEQRQLKQSGLVTISAANAAAINARLDSSGYRGPRLTTGIFEMPIQSTNLMGKVDHQAASHDQVSVRYSLYRLDSERSRNAGGLVAPSASTGLRTMDHTLALSNMLVLSGRTVLESRAQFADNRLSAPPADTIGPAVSIAGVASFGTSSGNPARRDNRLFQLANNLSHQTGSHALRAGLDFIYNDDDIEFPRARRGSYVFSSLANFLAGVYNNAGFTQTFGVSTVGQSNPNLGLHAQDEWKPTTALTLNIGVRYDLQFLEAVNTDTNNISPRVGAAWSPVASRRTLVRANAGLFYDRVPLRAVANALLSAGNSSEVSQLRQVGVSVSPAQASAPVFPAILPAAVASATLPNLTTIQRDLDSAHSRQLGAEIEQQIGGTMTVTAGYQYVRSLDLLMSINQNVPACAAAGTNNGCRPNPSHGNNSQYSSAGEATYHGIHVSLVQRPARWGHYRISYTRSKSMNNLGEFFFSAPIDPTDVSKDWGRSDNDQRHRLVLLGSLQTSSAPAATIRQALTRGFRISGYVQAYSALPLNITSGVTTIQGTAGRPLVGGAFIPRNAGVGPHFFTLNARVARTFPLGGRLDLETLVEGFNLTNRRNASTLNGTFGVGAYPTSPSPTFREVTALGEPRSFQLAARLRF